MTAFRDLDHLRALKYLLRVGKGRGTRYCIADQSEKT